MEDKQKLNPIAIYDSGAGGLSVLNRMIEFKSYEKFIYFADLKNLPYGEKTPEELFDIAKKVFDFFKTKKVKAIVMACNTTSSIVYDKLKNDYDFKIYPIIQMSAEKIVKNNPNIKKIGVFSTNATAKSGAYKKYLNLFNQNLEVLQIGCSKWVEIVENQDFQSKNAIMTIEKQALKMKKFMPEKIILGCTHFPFLISLLEKYFIKDKIIDPASYFSQSIFEDLKKNNLLCNKKNLLNQNDIEFFASDNLENFKKYSKIFFNGKSIAPKLLALS